LLELKINKAQATLEFMNVEDKVCLSCGRKFEFRKKWAKNWSEIKYCSDQCRSNKNKYDFGPAIMALLHERGPAKTICPSEVLSAAQKSAPDMMEHVRRSARLLVASASIEITQGGRVVDPSDFHGPIRLRLKK
jgi:hypothetical protein